MKKISVLLLFFLMVIPFYSKENTKLKEIEKIIYIFNSGDYENTVDLIKNFDFENVYGKNKKLILIKLKLIGDTFTKRKKFKYAKSVYDAIKDNSNDYWQLGNSLQKYNKLKDGGGYSLRIILSQLTQISKNFDAKFLTINTLFGSIFFAGILLFFASTVFIFIKKFKLAAYDIFIDANGDLNKTKVIMVFLTLFWPILILSGWSVYPFLFAGFCWIYMSVSEKRLVIIQISLVIIVSFVFSFRNFIDNSFLSRDFKIAKIISLGKLYEKNEYSRFDNDLKVLQAFAYFKNGDVERSLDILLSTGENYINILKFNLMGDIYFRSNNFKRSIKYLKSALEINEKNKTALYNFAMVLSSQNNIKVYESYAKRYPVLIKLKEKIGEIKDPVIGSDYLWNRLLKRSGNNGGFLKIFAATFNEFIKLPILYFSIVFFIYIFLIIKLFPNAGNNKYCKKCNKIIDKSEARKSNNYCEQCYQLFQLKDIVFMEAKLSREKDLKKKMILRKGKLFITSLFIPGIILIEKGKDVVFSILSFLYFFCLIFSLSSIYIFKKIYGLYPIYLNLFMILSTILYLSINLYSLKGDDNGI